MRRRLASSVVILIAVSGCHHVRVDVDCRRTQDPSLHALLYDANYVIKGVNENVESSLAFKEFACMLESVLRMKHPHLIRVAANSPSDFVLTMNYRVVDRGAGIETYPVYGHGGWGYWGYRHPGYYGVVGTRVETVDLGYVHSLFLSAFKIDKNQHTGRTVIWEGNAELNSSQRSLKLTMPYLMVAMEPYYGRATERPVRVKLDPDDACAQSITSLCRFGDKSDHQPE